MSSGTFRFLLGLMAPILLAGAERNRSWDVLVQSLKTGKSVVVFRMGGGHVEGKLLAIDGNSITVKERGQPQVISRADVFRVRYANIRRRNTLAGMAIGTAAGAVIFAAASSSRGAAAGVGVMFGVAFGALGGGVVPIGAPLYQAEKPLQPGRRTP